MTTVVHQPDFPAFEFGQSRWATARTENVDVVAERWTSRPNYVQVLSDPRLGSAQLVMLRKDIFERAVATIDALLSGRLAVSFELEQATQFTTILVAQAKDESMRLLAQTVLRTFEQVRARLVSFGTVTPLAATPLDDDELALVEAQRRRDAEE